MFMKTKSSGGRDREYAARYDDIDPYQRQPAPAQEQRAQGPSRTRPGAGRNLPSRSAAPVRGRRQDVEPPVEQEEHPPQTRQRKPPRGKENTQQRGGTDWEIPAFLRVQKRGRNNK